MTEFTTTEEDMTALLEMADYGLTVPTDFYVFSGDDGIVQIQFKIGPEDDYVTVGAFAMTRASARCLAHVILGVTETDSGDEVFEDEVFEEIV